MDAVIDLMLSISAVLFSFIMIEFANRIDRLEDKLNEKKEKL